VIRRIIQIECPPGDPQPGDLIGGVIRHTGLPLRESVRGPCGWWTWDYSDISPERWKQARSTIHQRLVQLHERGMIRYGRVSPDEGDERTDPAEEVDSSAPEERADSETQSQQHMDELLITLNVERMVSSTSGIFVVTVSVKPKNLGANQH